MTERKTLNRYYPVDYDPAKIPKLKQTEKDKNRLWGIRVMAPFNMRCNTCGDYIYKGKKFNSKKETVTTEDYLGIQIHRFYIRCPKCVAVIAFKTDPENCDYTLETGATRNFEAAKTLMDMEKKKQKAAEEEEAANPMKVLENRTKQSRNEMDTMEALNELREINARHEKVDHEAVIKKAHLYQQELAKLQKEEEDRLVKELFGSVEETSSDGIKRIESDEEEDEDWELPPTKRVKTTNCTDLLTAEQRPKEGEKSAPSTSGKGLPHKRSNSKSMLSNLVRIKKPVTKSADNCSEAAKDPQTNGTSEQSSTAENNKTDTKPIGALGMLGNYSCSSSEGDSD